MASDLALKMTPLAITIRDVVNGYFDDDEDGVVGYGGKLNIRPPFQRNFIYLEGPRNEVIHSITRGFPINTMFWSLSDDGTYELLDGQQRTVSFCQYVDGKFSVDHRTFGNLTKGEQDQILDYPLMVYVCEGSEKAKLEWFKIINVAGEKLTNQELRNAIYAGEWLAEAKRYFSKTGCVAYKMAGEYMNGSPIRQAYLETALKWIANRDKITIEDYMSEHQHDTNCNELWLYFQAIINWVRATFPKYRGKLMKGLDWGILYNKYSSNSYDPKKLENQIVELLEDDDVTNHRGIYTYLLDGDERHLSIRAFTPRMKRAAYERQKGVCPKCGKHFTIEEMEADHITPWSRGGKTIPENCQMLCVDCNRRKSNI